MKPEQQRTAAYRALTWLVRQITQPCEYAQPDAGGRARLPDRRPAVRETLTWQDSQGGDHQADVSFGFGRDGRVREVFCLAAKDGTDMQALVHDACIAASIALQRGHTIAALARAFGELREEGQSAGRPASVIGALARLGVEIETGIGGGQPA